MEVIVDHSIREFSLFASMLQMSPAVVSTTTILLPPTCQLRLCLPAPLRFDDIQSTSGIVTPNNIIMHVTVSDFMDHYWGDDDQSKGSSDVDHSCWMLFVWRVGCWVTLFSLLFSQSQQTHGCCHEVHPTDLCFILQKLPCDIVSPVQCMWRHDQTYWCHIAADSIHLSKPATTDFDAPWQCVGVSVCETPLPCQPEVNCFNARRRITSTQLFPMTVIERNNRLCWQTENTHTQNAAFRENVKGLLIYCSPNDGVTKP